MRSTRGRRSGRSRRITTDTPTDGLCRLIAAGLAQLRRTEPAERASGPRLGRAVSHRLGRALEAVLLAPGVGILVDDRLVDVGDAVGVERRTGGDLADD